MQDNDQIAVRYCDSNGEISENSNPNGSIQNIAGVFNEKKNIFFSLSQVTSKNDFYEIRDKILNF